MAVLLARRSCLRKRFQRAQVQFDIPAKTPLRKVGTRGQIWNHEEGPGGTGSPASVVPDREGGRAGRRLDFCRRKRLAHLARWVLHDSGMAAAPAKSGSCALQAKYKMIENTRSEAPKHPSCKGVNRGRSGERPSRPTPPNWGYTRKCGGNPQRQRDKPSRNRKKNETDRCETIDARVGIVVKSGSIDYRSRQGGAGVATCESGSPFGVEGKEFLLTVALQSVMNIFTASGLMCNFVSVTCEHRRHDQ